MKRKLTCYALGGEQGWEAICVDLDLAVQGATFDEVYASFKVAIHEFIEVAALENAERAENLLNRRAPLSVRLKHKLGFLWAWLRNGSGNDSQTAGFTVACTV